METPKIHESEYRFCLILWEHEPITAVELAAGLLVNRGYHVWDYRQMPLNFLGQICLPYSLLWMPVSYGAMRLYNALNK